MGGDIATARCQSRARFRPDGGRGSAVRPGGLGRGAGRPLREIRAITTPAITMPWSERGSGNEIGGVGMTTHGVVACRARDGGVINECVWQVSIQSAQLTYSSYFCILVLHES